MQELKQPLFTKLRHKSRAGGKLLWKGEKSSVSLPRQWNHESSSVRCCYGSLCSSWRILAHGSHGLNRIEIILSLKGLCKRTRPITSAPQVQLTKKKKEVTPQVERMKSHKSACVCPIFFQAWEDLLDTVVIEVSVVKALRLRDNLRRLYRAKHLPLLNGTYSDRILQWPNLNLSIKVCTCWKLDFLFKPLLT